MKVVALIPARMASSRFPGKPLALIAGLPMIEHVRRRVLLSDAVDEVIVATCDQDIMDAVTGFGGRAVMTRDDHERCTDRIEEAARDLDMDIAVLVQGDEPLFDPDLLPALVRPLLDDPELPCSNIITLIQAEAEMQDKDVVKAVLDEAGGIMCFSRSPIPFHQSGPGCARYRQTGIAAFRKDFLHAFAALPPTALEVAESVDFLRILGHRQRIKAVIHHHTMPGVDRPRDVANVEAQLLSDPRQRELFARITRP